jgi:hypothetical protein
MSYLIVNTGQFKIYVEGNSTGMDYEVFLSIFPWYADQLKCQLLKLRSNDYNLIKYGKLDKNYL